MALITVGECTARLIADDAADHVVTAILDDSEATPGFLKAAVPGVRAVLTTRHEVIEVVIVGTDPQARTVTFTIGDPS